MSRGCPIHGNVWCTCSSASFQEELEQAAKAGKKLAEDFKKWKEKKTMEKDPKTQKIEIIGAKTPRGRKLVVAGERRTKKEPPKRLRLVSGETVFFISVPKDIDSRLDRALTTFINALCREGYDLSKAEFCVQRKKQA